jgi:molecular chaperone GrpE (heat shock protein)
MQAQTEPKLTKWPFFMGDALLLGLAWYIWLHGARALDTAEMCLAIVCVMAGAGLIFLPFLLEHRAKLKLAEAHSLATVVGQFRNLEAIAAQISGASSQWERAQEQAEKTSAAAQQMAERMTAEVKGFAEFMERANDREKAALRLENEKFRRAESEWLQVLVRMLDHVYALHVGALRSSQPALIEQVGNFQNACRDVARRVGLTPFVAVEAEPYDGHRHQLADSDDPPPAGAKIAETIAAGYTFQGRLLRPALVRLRNGNGS